MNDRTSITLYCAEPFHEGKEPVRGLLYGHRSPRGLFWGFSYVRHDDLPNPVHHDISGTSHRANRPSERTRGEDMTRRVRLTCNCGLDILVADRLGVGYQTLIEYERTKAAWWAELDAGMRRHIDAIGTPNAYERPVLPMETLPRSPAGHPSERYERNAAKLWRVVEAGVSRLSLTALALLGVALLGVALLGVANSDVDHEIWLTFGNARSTLRVGPHLAPTLDA